LDASRLAVAERTMNGRTWLHARINDPLSRMLLSVAGCAMVALAVGLLAGPAWGWGLLSAELFYLLAYQARRSLVTQRRAARSLGRILADGVPARDDTITGWWQRADAVEPQEGSGRPLSRGAPVGKSHGYGVAILDREYCVVWCNSHAAAHFGIDPERDMGRPIDTLVQQRSFVEYMIEGDYSKSLRIKATEGDALTLTLQCVPYVVDNHWLVLSRNVTRSERLEALRRDCVANVSHELRTPLTVLVGFLETVRELKLDPRMSLEYLDRMEKQCARMQRIIEDLLQLSTLESAPQPPCDKRVNLGMLLARIHGEAEALSGGRHRIVLDAEGGFDLVGAESEIASAFGNLASNAVRYTPPGGEVRLIWRGSETGGEFSVVDSGIGIEKHHIPRLTQRFYRVDRDRSRQSGGTGLGLAIVKHTLVRHQATLEIESEPGKGSRFTAKFPAYRMVAATARFTARTTVQQPAAAMTAFTHVPRSSAGVRVP
jgi:two-component system phosphate regulon sensor histidine kinase PhoR